MSLYLCMETENICFSKFPLKLPLLSLLVLAVLHVDSQVSALGLKNYKTHKYCTYTNFS